MGRLFDHSTGHVEHGRGAQFHDAVDDPRRQVDAAFWGDRHAASGADVGRAEDPASIHPNG